MPEQHEQKAEDRRTLSAKLIHQAILRDGREELDRTTAALAWSGLAAGLSMGFSMAAEGILRAHLPDADWRPLVAKLGYPVGFLAVVLGSQQLFTESTLLATIPVLHDRKRFGDMLRLWSVVLAANLLGAFLFAAAAAHTTIFSADVREAFGAIGQEALQHSFATALGKGIAGGWLVALMVWMLPASESARVWTIIVITYLIGAGELTHIVAGSVETLYLVTTGEASFGAYVTRYLVPVLIGNTIGGVILVAALNHAQVVGGEEA